MMTFDTTDGNFRWTANSTTGGLHEYQKDLKSDLIRYIQQADRHTLRLLWKFVQSLER